MSARSDTPDQGFWADSDDDVARRRYRDLLDSLEEGVFQLGPEGDFVAVNDAFVETTGRSRAELVGAHVSLLFDPDAIERLEGEDTPQRNSRGATTVELSVQTASDRPSACVMRVAFLPTDGEGTLGIVRWHGEARPSSEQASAAPVDVLLTIIEETEGAAFILDDTFEVVWADETVGQFFGVDSEGLAGRDKRTVVNEVLKWTLEDPEAFAERVQATYDDNTYVEEFECHVTAGEGRKERWLKHWSKPITSGQYAGGRIECYTDVSDRRQSADALEQTRQEFASLVDAVTEYAIIRLDPEGTVSSWNEGAREIKGYEATEILGEHFSTFYSQEDRAAGVPERNLQEAAARGSIEDEGWRIRKDGSRFWANATITAISNEDGDHRGFLKITRDMTERHAYQEGLESELQGILSRISDAFFAVDEKWRFTYVNDQARSILAAASPDDSGPPDLLDRTLWEAVPDLTGTTFDEQYHRAMESQEAVAFEEYFDPLDTWFEVRAYPSASGISVYFRDVTERRERQQQLREREEELEEYRAYTDDILNAFDDLFYVVDREGRYERWNETLCAVTGYSDAEIESMDPLELVVDEDRDRVARSIEEIFETGTRRIEATIQTRAGEEIPIEFVASAVETPDGKPVVAGIGRDISERKQRQQQLEASNERLEQFAYAASHDLQEPLRMVSSYLRLIEGRYQDTLDEDGREFLEFAVDGADRMRDMIDGLLAYSRIESEGAQFEPVDLDDVLEDVQQSLQMMRAEHDADINVGSLPVVEGDREQLGQLFQNLLDNAMTYSGDEPPRIQVSADRDGSQWVVSVSDDGIGIDPADADRIFDVFQRLDGPDEEGSGIGLALCKRIVERHEGDIWVHSTPGDGATFSFTLPEPGEDDG